MKLLATISSALAGSPGIDFYLNDGVYWPIGSCASDKGCSAWKISTKPGWENTWAMNLKCDLEIEKCTCADDWVDLDNDPLNGCESPAGMSVFGDKCYYSSCMRDDKCQEFHPGLVCSAVTGCCECEGEEPLRPTVLGQSTGCLDKNCPEGGSWSTEWKWCVCDDGRFPFYNDDRTDSVCCPPGLMGYFDADMPCKCPDGSEPNPDSADPCNDPTGPDNCPDGQVFNPDTGGCECKEGFYDTQAFATFLQCCPEGSVWKPAEQIGATNTMGECVCPDGLFAVSFDPFICCPEGSEWNPDLQMCEEPSHCPPGTWHVAGTSPPMCCPLETVFNPDTKQCEDSIECPPGTYPIPNTDPLQCCKDGEIWDVEQDMCTDGENRCPDGEYLVPGTDICCPVDTFLDFETRECLPKTDECPPGTYPILNTDPLQCCKDGTYWNPEKEICADPSDPTDPIEECPKGFYQVAGVMPLQCCPDGSRWIPEMRECLCPDETLPVAGQYPACGEPEVCPPGEYPALLEPEIICCLKGTKYDVASGLCLCPDETPVDDMGLCTECPDGFYAALRFPELVCCPENTWYEGQMRECLCPDMTKPDENGECVDPTDKCEKPYKYDFTTGLCVCWNGMEPIRGDPSISDPTITVDEFGCFPTDCLEGENAFYDKEDNLVCCRDGLVYNFQKDMCVCKDGNLPTATGDCATCDTWENAFFIGDQIICCGVNEYYAADHNHCMCTDGSHVAECPFPCKENEVHEIDHSGNSPGECIPMCEDGHVFNRKTKTCTCPDGRPIVEGYPGGCPPVTVSCEIFFLPWDTLMGTVCCHEEAHFNRELDQCVCNDGSRPDSRGFCGKSCPEQLVYAPYPPTGEFACLCPETLKFPNAEGVCMENPCEKPLNPFKLPDGSVACCPEQSYFDMEKRSCICLSTRQPPNADYECPEKCPDDTVPVFDAETGELNCIAIDCAPGFYLAYAEICCRNDMKFDKELFMCVCPLGLSDDGGKCSEKCSYGSVWDGQDCVSKCPQGQIYRNEQCYCALDGTVASRDKPCCKFGESWDAEKGICTCDGDLFCEKPCPEDRPNLFLDKFGDRQCCKKGMNFDVIVHMCMCNPRSADLPAFKPLDGSCTCPDGKRQMMSADGTFFSCIDAGCVNGLVLDEKTGMCACPDDSWLFWNSIEVPVCCKRDQKWSEELQECICHETNLPANDDGECEDLGEERCPPGWTYIKEQVSFFGEPVRCMPICPEPSIVYVKPVDEVMIGGIAATVECMCKGDQRYNGTTDNMIDYILHGSCEVEECPPGLVRSDDILTFNECTCPYKWQQLIQTASIPPQLMCTCDDEKYEINPDSGMCECKPSIADFGVFGVDGSCDCPRHMRYNPENDACEEISTGTVIDIDENCWYYDFELGACLSKDQFDEQFDTKPTANPFDQITDECPGFEVGWKGIKSSKINYKSPTGYLIHVNVLNNQANVDVTVEDYIGFLIFSKRYCGIEFIKELDNGNVKIDFFDKTAAYDKSEVYVRLDKAQSQTVVQFTTNHARDDAGNPALHLATSKKDQFLVHIQLENEIDFLFEPEDCLTRFNIGVMKSEMDFTQDYTHCVANTLWWSPAVIEE